MIILKSEIYSRFSNDKDFIYNLHEVISCPDCQQRLYAHGQCKRKVYRYKPGEKDKDTEIHHLLAMECRECHRTHRILPEDIIPNKRYDAESFSRICTEKLQVSEQTYYRLRRWAVMLLAVAEEVDVSMVILEKTAEALMTSIIEAVSFLVNTKRIDIALLSCSKGV